MNMRNLATEITLKEGGKISMSVAQVSEVIRLVMKELALLDDDDVIKAVNKYRR